MSLGGIARRVRRISNTWGVALGEHTDYHGTEGNKILGRLIEDGYGMGDCGVQVVEDEGLGPGWVI